MSMFSFVSAWNVKDELLALLLALRDTRTPIAGKVFAILSVLYLISPVDMLLDTIPLLGFFDDLILVPLGVWLSRQNIPPEVLESARLEAKKYTGKMRTVAHVLLGIVLVWLLLLIVSVYFLVRMLVS